MEKSMRRGDIFWVFNKEIIGSEQGGTRPMVIIQNNMGNNHSPTTIVASITSKKKSHMPTHVILPENCGLLDKSTVLLESIQTIDKKRIDDYIGHLGKDTMQKINIAIEISLGLR